MSGAELSRSIVAAELERVRIKAQSSLHGFELEAGWRLTHSGGISGRGDRAWWLERATGADRSEMVNTMAGLRCVLAAWQARLLREALTTPPPSPPQVEGEGKP